MTHDVCLLLEGSYPYVVGGVSSWTHALVKALPDVDFTALCILPSSEVPWEPVYPPLPNFREHQVFHLHDPTPQERTRGKRPKPAAMAALRRFHKSLMQGGVDGFDEAASLFREGGVSIPALMHGGDAWEMLLDHYRVDESEDSFIDYFWTYRISHAPLFRALQARPPEARAYHALSTGYAGLVGAAQKAVTGRPLLLTEHGLYFKERRIEIAQAEWIFAPPRRQARPERELNRLHAVWVRLFHALSRITYSKATRIFTLFEGNREQEIADGADPASIEVLPNAIDPDRFLDLRTDSGGLRDKPTPVVGFVGRVTPIKDVKTFIRAMKMVAAASPRVEARIMGPTEEDPWYAESCRELVRELGLEDVVRFTGNVNVVDHYPDLDVLVLTSMSEAQPLVLLEAPCAGIPCVATDVGACRELLEGRTPEDRALGPSGMVSRPADPADTARCILHILNDPDVWEAMSLAGRKRVLQYYGARDLYDRYAAAYRECMLQEA